MGDTTFEGKIIVVQAERNRKKKLFGYNYVQMYTLLCHVIVEQLRLGNQTSQLIYDCAVIAKLLMFVSIGYENKAGRTINGISKYASKTCQFLTNASVSEVIKLSTCYIVFFSDNNRFTRITMQTNNVTQPIWSSFCIWYPQRKSLNN